MEDRGRNFDTTPVDLSDASSTEHSPDRVLWNFALLLIDDAYELRLTPVKNQDQLSRESALRRAIDWILAKHVVASGYHEATVFAGEGWVYRSADRSQLTVCVNENSGTYKPSTSQLEAFGKLVESVGVDVRLFPRS